MPKTYTTRQGETVDMACDATYGRTDEVTETVLAANPGLAALGPVLPMGTVIIMPDVADPSLAPKLNQLWD